MTTELITTTPAQQRQAAADRLETLKLEAEAKAMEGTLRLLEAPQPVPVPWHEYPAFDHYNNFPTAYDRPFFQTSPEDRTEGRYRPLYENEHDLRRIRADARRLYNLFPVAQGAIEALCNYTIGNGWEFEVKPKKAHKLNGYALGIVPIVQAVLDKFLERNDFCGKLDRQIHNESRIDGVTVPALYPDDDANVRVELINPDFILRPLEPQHLERMLRCGHRLNHWWHGVHTQHNYALKRDDVTRPLGVHCVFDKLGDQWDYLPIERIQIINRNVGADARIGVSDFLVVLRDFEHEAKIRRNTAEGAAILAAIVLIRQHAEGVTRSSIEGMVSDNATSTYDKMTHRGPRTTNVENTAPGTVKDMPFGMQAMLGPLGTLRSPVYIEVAQYLLRIIGERWNMPEYLISGDASNANYSSTLVAEGPFVKAREHDQAFYAAHFEGLLWKALAMYSKLGAFPSVPWQQIAGMLDIKAEYTSPASRDRQQQADVNKILSDAGLLSDRTFAADMGLDLDEEKANGAVKAPPAPSPFGAPGGAPGGGFDDVPRPLGESRLHELAANALRNLVESERWITLDNGVHVKIDDGESVSDAIADLKADDRDRVRGDGPQAKAGEERGATAVYKGKKYRTAPARAKLNIDQMNELMKERGFTVGTPETSAKTGWKTFYPVKKDGRAILIPAKAIGNLLAAEGDTLDDLMAIAKKLK